jgi:hypothetical protein
MSKCSRCDVEIKHLNWEHHKIAFGQIYPDGKKDEDYPTGSLEKDVWFHCPECGKELFDNEDNALEFLRG